MLAARERARLLDPIHQRLGLGRIIPGTVEDEALEIEETQMSMDGASVSTVDGGREQVPDAKNLARISLASCPPDLYKRSPSPQVPACQDVAVPVGTEKTGAASTWNEAQVVDDLGHDARPVDRVHAPTHVWYGTAGPRTGLLLSFDSRSSRRLAMPRHIFIIISAHLGLLNWACAVLGVQYKTFHALLASDSRDGGRTSITGSSSDDREALWLSVFLLVSTCVEIELALLAIDATLSPRPRRLDGGGPRRSSNISQVTNSLVAFHARSLEEHSQKLESYVLERGCP